MQSMATSRGYVVRVADDDDGDDVHCERFCNEQIHASFNLSVYVYSLVLLRFIYGSFGRK